MSFTSALYPGEPIINDTEGLELTHPPRGVKTGLRLPFALPGVRRYEGVAEPFPSELLIPRSEWQARIQEQEERKTRLSDLAMKYGLPCKDQDGTNYCWINGPVHNLEVTRLQQNEEMVILSPASAGAPIKGFRNVGGWGLEGLEWLAKNGCCPVENWPANAIQRSYYTEENKKIALKYRADEWWELRPRNLDEMVSLLLRNYSGAGGYNWWGHEITIYEAVWIDGEVATRIRNSWGMGWGTQGFGILQGSRMYADDLVSARTAFSS